MPEGAENGVIRKVHADARKFIADIAQVAADVVADHQLAALEIAVYLIGAIGKNVAPGKLLELIYAQPVHAAGIAIDALGLEIEIFAVHPATLLS